MKGYIAVSLCVKQESHQRSLYPFLEYREEYSEVEKWRYVPTKIKPANYASRGLPAPSFDGKSSGSFRGPEFMRTPEDRW